ncbi:hypothetical protein V8E54_011064 [Elaphomyces granulatus]
MEHIAKALNPIKAVVWGEMAMIYLGVPIIPNSFMLIPAEKDFAAAVKKLEDAGFHRTPWTYGTTVDPKIITDPTTLRVHKRQSKKYERFDHHSVRFNFPSSFDIKETVVLLESCYANLSPPSDGQISIAPYLSIPQFSVDGNLYYPNELVLMESFIRVLLVEKAAGNMKNDWSLLLSVWIISYICGWLDVGVDALDDCEDDRVRDWYNKNIMRDQGGLNRAINKRTGRIVKRGVVPCAG